MSNLGRGGEREGEGGRERGVSRHYLSRPYSFLQLMNLVVQHEAAMTKKISGGSSSMYWERMSVPVSQRSMTPASRAATVECTSSHTVT